MKTLSYFFTLLTATVLGQTPTEIIAPPGQPGTLSATRTPFLIFSNEAASVRYQQVYDSSDFRRDGNLQWQISGISFTVGLGGMDFTLPNVEISFSTTQKAPDGLSSLFVQNIGPDSMVVFSGPLRLSASGTFEFNLRIPLQHAFTYNAGSGNLLLEVKNFQTIPSPGFQPVFGAYGILGDSSSLAVALDVNSEIALLGTGALSTRFTAIAVPEPSSIVLFTVGGSMVGLVGWRTRRRNRCPSLRKPEGKDF